MLEVARHRPNHSGGALLLAIPSAKVLWSRILNEPGRDCDSLSALEHWPLGQRSYFSENRVYLMSVVLLPMPANSWESLSPRKL